MKIENQHRNCEPEVQMPAGRYDFPTDRITDGMTLERIISRCGELQLDHTHVCRLCRDLCDPTKLLQKLQDPESDESEWYSAGVAHGILKLSIDLEYNISEPKSKDAYKHLASERRRQAINRKLEELFGI